MSGTPGVALHTHGDSAGLNSAWRESVGAPVAIDHPGEAAPAGTIALLCWNIWIGRGRLAKVIHRIRDGKYAAHGLPRAVPIVVMVQEAYREGDAVPVRRAARTAPRTVLRGSEDDIVATADELKLSLRYAPSMRNGRHRSDRGSAILSSLALTEAEAIELPFTYQRRVAVVAAVDLRRPGGAAVRLRVTSAHLDPRGATARDILGVAGRARQAEGLLRHLDTLPREPQILGADLNLARGAAEPAYRRFAEAEFTPGLPGTWPAWSHTFHRWPRLLLDWVLVRDPAGALAGVVVRRLDEEPDDRGLLVYGSDHHPLLARVDLAPD